MTTPITMPILWLRNNKLLIVIFVVQFVAIMLDVWDDLSSHATSDHFILHLVFGSLSLLGLVVILIEVTHHRKRLTKLLEELSQTQQTLWQKNQQTRRLKGELAQAIHEQFDQWQLSDAEKEIALLLIKGLTLEEIASLRHRAEKTVRQQASAIYSKANVNGRHALSAYFFEDLLS